MPKLILITGDRNWNDYPAIERVLKRYVGEFHTLVHGAARGADTLAGEAAKKLGFEVFAVPAHWKHHDLCSDNCREMCGRPAGNIRNKKMLTEYRPDLVLAFHDDLFGTSRGTKHMVKIARRAGVPVKLFRHKIVDFS